MFTEAYELTEEEKLLLQKVLDGDIAFRKIEEFADPLTAVKIRRLAIQEYGKLEFEHIQNFSLDVESVTKRNIENMIGAVQIPLGVAGLLKVNGEYAAGEYYIPLATTEGALVASVNRGCSVITRSGGANVRVFEDEMTRAPVFKLESLERARKFYDWVKSPETFEQMKQAAEKTTRFGKLLSVKPFVTGTYIYLRFSYDTKDAMGMNMVTIATDAVMHLIEDEFGAHPVTLSGNMCTDKKPASISAILGRGKTVVAEVTIPQEIVKETLKCTPESMFEVNYSKNLLGSARAGAMGFNAHAANIIAAVYLACGQDAAHVVEGSTAITSMELTKYEEIHCSVTLPALPVGTVGGGTGLGTQRDCLNILGVAGAGDTPGINSRKFAEIVASAVLAGEISLIGAQAAGHLARAHAQLGRGKF
ncbi:hydroxymethylglutaryl-CoA reductase (NADPH) [Methanosarcina mazei]|jgi:hydroxymethylglutaryl-CoA reductase (NADPH)|uniref:3-hydroxy-3-methylglutaryl coenzyme A reductase n=6 Tax=Methanosarcina mazei TaxID=2209 RepID=A0A0F8IEH1_METMZ|nr:hydroxymethylglutaryl-CoA reductase (NADPH) [Methanosarcina mazei]AGF95791.1 Hydroxymethylglutaryl-CoA reductase [Methanosarcina mazei Tuc01]AKB39945.1 Hydroxymethylglutaryl-CoA reductase [Methanosarcina mazei WWM610]AKB60906.1 Hydroxymethylglutaryl-CoA reductase [Methanosarcina mazei SarPi]AKB67507.1 Hydroxymethylglutaryl-CoA reductase [Methanosarcina mazei LYC]AKB70858.1 Hydroxymethylglutaryl-CoA reductase [Methanosarcina mazei C16]